MKFGPVSTQERIIACGSFANSLGERFLMCSFIRFLSSTAPPSHPASLPSCARLKPQAAHDAPGTTLPPWPARRGYGREHADEGNGGHNSFKLDCRPPSRPAALSQASRANSVADGSRPALLACSAIGNG